MQPTKPSKVQKNDPARAGQLASRKVLFGGSGEDASGSRYAVYAVHTRFDAVSWFVSDAEQLDEATELPAIIRQATSFEEAVAGVAK